MPFTDYRGVAVVDSPTGEGGVNLNANFKALASSLGFANALINGNFDIWQRGTSFSSPGYGCDRWYTSTGVGGSPAVTVSRQSFSPGQTDVPGEPRYFLRFDQTGAATTKGGVLEQRVESVRTFAAETVVLAYHARVAAGSVSVTPEFIQGFGAGSSDPQVWTYGATATVTTSWQRFTTSVTLPSISGKTIGSSGDRLAVLLRMPASTTFTFDVANVQLQLGETATAFERRPAAIEWALCERYYREVKSAMGSCQTDKIAQLVVEHSGMRAAPTAGATDKIKITDFSTADYEQSSANLTTLENDANGGRFQLGNFTGLTANRPIGMITSSAGAISLNAEL